MVRRRDVDDAAWRVWSQGWYEAVKKRLPAPFVSLVGLGEVRAPLVTLSEFSEPLRSTGGMVLARQVPQIYTSMLSS
jgi:hypothetical protein